jgi:hypothetical protein
MLGRPAGLRGKCGKTRHARATSLRDAGGERLPGSAQQPDQLAKVAGGEGATALPRRDLAALA